LLPYNISQQTNACHKIVILLTDLSLILPSSATRLKIPSRSLIITVLFPAQSVHIDDTVSNPTTGLAKVILS
jgi:hypothetical protein